MTYSSLRKLGPGIMLLCLSCCASISAIPPELDAVLKQGIFDPDQCLRERARSMRVATEVASRPRLRQVSFDDGISSLLDAVSALQRVRLSGERKIAEAGVQALITAPNLSQDARAEVQSLVALAAKRASDAPQNELLGELAATIARAQRAREQAMALEAALAWHAAAAYRLCEARLNGWSADGDSDYWRQIVDDYVLSQKQLNALLQSEPRPAAP